ncbi:MAG: MlaE family ABC transporter permease [Planctomycetota bacterium]|jgi:phospholipid/cholesterol/gamma-HCH transport system permease protein
MPIVSSAVEKVGAFCNAQLRALGATIRFGGSAAWYSVRGLTTRRIYPRHELVVQMDYTGARSTPIMVLLGFLIGASMVLQTYPSIARHGPGEIVAGVVGVSILRTLGPFIASIIFAGRVGAGYTAELGTMAVSEEILALKTMGINPIGYLVAPRFLAAVLMLPACTVLFNFAALGGGYLVGIYQFKIPHETWMETTLALVPLSNFIFGLCKSVVFAVIISLVCCYKGYNVKGSGIEVGRATMSAIVTCLVAVVVADFIMSLMFNFLHRVGVVG